jgi:hypothetical protein
MATVEEQQAVLVADNNLVGDNKKQVGVKLTGEARRLRAALSRKLGIDQTAVIELAIRQMAQREGVA